MSLLGCICTKKVLKKRYPTKINQLKFWIIYTYILDLFSLLVSTHNNGVYFIKMKHFFIVFAILSMVLANQVFVPEGCDLGWEYLNTGYIAGTNGHIPYATSGSNNYIYAYVSQDCKVDLLVTSISKDQTIGIDIGNGIAFTSCNCIPNTIISAPSIILRPYESISFTLILSGGLYYPLNVIAKDHLDIDWGDNSDEDCEFKLVNFASMPIISEYCV